jgi:hypothetical protein
MKRGWKWAGNTVLYALVAVELYVLAVYGTGALLMIYEMLRRNGIF